jgi:hypothetical protein
MAFQIVPSIHPKIYDAETDMAILSSTRDMPRGTAHIIITVGGRVAISFDLRCETDYTAKTITYFAPLEKIAADFKKNRNMFVAFQSEEVCLSKLLISP